MIKIDQKKDFSKNKKNLFIVTNEIQLINANEARHHYKSENSIFLFLEMGHNKDTKALNKYKEKLDCDQLIVINLEDQMIGIGQHIKLIKYLKQYVYDKIFIGYFSAKMRQYICNLSYENIFLIDDGTYTIVLHDELYNNRRKDTPSMLKTAKLRYSKSIIYKFGYYIYNELLRLIFSIFGLKNDLIDYHISFFTIYNLIQYNNEKIIKNKYALLREKHQTSQKSFNNDKTVYFLGQSLHKTLGITATEYRSYLNSIIQYYKEKNIKIKYIPHRSENSFYKEVGLLLESEYFSMVNIDKPFELYILQKDILPYRVASFFSSALFTTKSIYPSVDIDSFIINFDKNKRRDIVLVYETLQKEGIHLINI